MQDSSSLTRVFVYGTLKRGQPNYHLMKDGQTTGKSRYVGEAKTVKKYPLIVATPYHIPFMLFEEGKGHNVIGEIYEVDDDNLQKCDKLENHPILYERVEIEVEMLTGKLFVEENSSRVVKTLVYMLVKYRPNLLSLPFYDTFDINALDEKYIPPKDRSLPWRTYWHVVHTGFEENSPE